MADTSILSEVAGQFASKIFSGILWFGLAALVIGILGFTMYYFLIYKKKFNIKVKIISQRAEDKNSIIFDRAAILTDKKTRSKFFRLWNTKIDLPTPKFNILQLSNQGDYLELYRTGEDIIYYLTPTQINKREMIRADGKIFIIAGQETKQIDPDMTFWATKRKVQNKGMFDTEKMWMKILPYIPQILGGVFIIFTLWILMSHLPGILSQLKSLTEALAQSQRGYIATVG